MHHLHTGEDIVITYKRDGRYDEAALAKLDWFLRDWRKGQSTRMDPRLIDLLWEVQREAGSTLPIQIVCGYRSPQTNAMLRHNSEGVARNSQHILGRAMDFFIPGVRLEQLREIGLRLERGGVGFYPQSGSPFVHMDVGGIRMWPRMTREQLVRVFPDGRTVQIPTDGVPLPGYAQALADVTRHGAVPSENSLAAARKSGIDVEAVLASNDRPQANPFAKLLGLAKDDKDQADLTAAVASGAATPKPIPVAAVAKSADAKPVQAHSSDKTARAMEKLKLVHVAKLLPAPPAPAQPSPRQAHPAAAATPNQIIAERGYWQGPPDGNPLVTLASAAPDSTGSVGQFAARADQGSLALGYAEPSADNAGALTGIAALRAAALAAQARRAVAGDTTVAVKRGADQLASSVMAASSAAMTVVRSGAHFANPWLRAIVLSPSVQHFLTTVALGERDFRSLAALMIKPKNAVKMTFAADPNPGLSPDRFSGAAIVFVSTVSYPGTATHTAALQ